MDPMRRLHSGNVTLALVIACCITAAAIWLFSLPGPPRIGDARVNSVPSTDVDHVQSSGSHPGELVDTRAVDYGEILARPLFSPTRRPAPDTAFDDPEPLPQSPASQISNGDIKLVGIIIEDENRFALLQTAPTLQTQRAQVGEVVDGWRITALKPSSATLERGAQAKTLVLERRSDPKLAAQAEAKIRRERLAAQRAKRKAQSATTTLPAPDNNENEPQFTDTDDDGNNE